MRPVGALRACRGERSGPPHPARRSQLHRLAAPPRFQAGRRAPQGKWWKCPDRVKSLIGSAAAWLNRFGRVRRTFLGHQDGVVFSGGDFGPSRAVGAGGRSCQGVPRRSPVCRFLRQLVLHKSRDPSPPLPAGKPTTTRTTPWKSCACAAALSGTPPHRRRSHPRAFFGKRRAGKSDHIESAGSASRSRFPTFLVRRRPAARLDHRPPKNGRRTAAVRPIRRCARCRCGRAAAAEERGLPLRRRSGRGLTDRGTAGRGAAGCRPGRGLPRLVRLHGVSGAVEVATTGSPPSGSTPGAARRSRRRGRLAPGWARAHQHARRDRIDRVRRARAADQLVGPGRVWSAGSPARRAGARPRGVAAWASRRAACGAGSSTGSDTGVACVIRARWISRSI